MHIVEQQRLTILYDDAGKLIKSIARIPNGLSECPHKKSRSGGPPDLLFYCISGSSRVDQDDDWQQCIWRDDLAGMRYQDPGRTSTIQIEGYV